MSGSYTYVKDELAFIFSLNKKKKYSIKKENNFYVSECEVYHIEFL